MAQIIKYEQGGSTSKKYGTFTIDGHKYDVNDEFLNQFGGIDMIQYDLEMRKTIELLKEANK